MLPVVWFGTRPGPGPGGKMLARGRVSPGPDTKQLFPNRDIVDNETVRRGGDVDWATADKFETFQPHLAPSELNDFVRKI